VKQWLGSDFGFDLLWWCKTNPALPLAQTKVDAVSVSSIHFCKTGALVFQWVYEKKFNDG